MIGMLLQGFGLKNAVAALPLEDWLAAISERRLQIKSSIHIKKFLAHEVQRAAQILREEYNRLDLRTFGWIDEDPGMWTSVKIVDMQPANGGPPNQAIRDALRKQFDDTIEFISCDSLTPGDLRILENRSLTV